MRKFLLVFVVWWVMGMMFGVLHLPDVVIIGAFALSFLFVLRLSLKLQYGVAATLLLALGYMWGSVQAVLPDTCASIEEVIQGRVVSIHRLEPSTAQYKVTSDTSLCTYLVTAPRFPTYSVGDELEIKGEVQAISDIPAEYEGYARYLERQGIDATVRFPTIHAYERTKAPLFRDVISAQINRVFSEPEASILQAMLLARVGSIPESIEEQFKHTSVSHILAISGSNISLLTGSLLGILLLLPIPPLARVGISIILLWLYIGMVDYQVSAVRAALFWTVAIIGTYLQVLLSLTTVVILTLVVMISFNPSLVLDVGFQLSFAAVIGIGALIFFTRSDDLIKRRHMVTLLLLASLGATLTTWPIILYYFGTISLIGLPANIIVVPLTSLFVLMGLLSLIISYIFFPAGLLLSYVTHLVWQAINYTTQLFAQVPGAYIENVSVHQIIVWMYYGGLIGVSLWWMKKHKRSWREVWQ